MFLVCASCGAPLQEGDVYCNRCGAGVADFVPAPGTRLRRLCLPITIVLTVSGVVFVLGAILLVIALNVLPPLISQRPTLIARTYAATQSAASVLSPSPEHLAVITPILSPTATPSPTVVATATPIVTPSPPPTETVTPMPPTRTPIPQPRIAFVSHRTGSPQIWVMRADGTQQLQLTSVGQNSSPSWPPDNSQIAFVSDRDGDLNVHVMSADGGNQTRMSSSGDHATPMWSRDGRLSYASNRDGNWEIYVDGRRVTHTVTNNRLYVWSPDGSQIVFEGESGTGRALYVIKADGSGLRQLTDSSYMSWNASWAPDGNRIVYASTESGNARIFTMQPDGGDRTALTSVEHWSQMPIWSPNGLWITFVGQRGDVWNLYRINSGGENQLRLAGYVDPLRDYSQSPTGDRICYASNADGDFEIYVVNADGTGQNKLTNNTSDDHSPVWSR